MNVGPIAIAIAVGVTLLGFAWLVNAGRPPRSRGEVPPNLSPFQTDDQLETTRLDNTLKAALLSSAFLAVGIPLYFLTEANRLEGFTEKFSEEAIERGHATFLENTPENPHGFSCITCHGAEGVGGVARYVEQRTGVEVQWRAPALNDIFFRHTQAEVRYWIVNGRANSPMPAWGVAAGGPLNDQQVDDLIAYLQSIQLTQAQALDQVEGRVTADIERERLADTAVVEAIARQQAVITELQSAPARLAILKPLVAELKGRLATGPNGYDGDRDGLSDEDEQVLTRVVTQAVEQVAVREVDRNALRARSFDLAKPFTTNDAAGEPLADLKAAEEVLTTLDGLALSLQIATDKNQVLLTAAETSLARLADIQSQRRYAVDLESVAKQSFEGDLDQATRAMGLFGAYCARCHTAGYSAGPMFTLEPGSGALGPSLRDGRSTVQFPNPENHYQFVLNGSDSGVGYGINGIGRGWMPGFGTVLSEEDLRLIVDFERGL